MEFSEDARRVLSGGGWYPGRRVDLAPVVDAMAARGVVIRPGAAAFLAEFHGLTLNVPAPQWGGVTRVRFDPVLAFEENFDCVGDAELRESYATLAEGPVSLIGECGDLILFMREDGCTFGYEPFCAGWAHIGTNVEETVNRLCAAKPRWRWEGLDGHLNKVRPDESS